MPGALAPLAATVRWQGRFEVADSAPDARLAPTNFHLPPGTNADFQKLRPAQVAPLALGVLLWGPQGAPMNGMGIAPRDLTRFPKYTGGLLVQDTDGDRQLDPAVDKVVGGIVGAAPQGATGQAATSPLGADGAPVMWGTVLRDFGFPAEAQGGKLNPGLVAPEPQQRRTDDLFPLLVDQDLHQARGLALLRFELVEQCRRGGTPLLLLHGITDAWRSFEPVLPVLPWLPDD